MYTLYESRLRELCDLLSGVSVPVIHNDQIVRGIVEQAASHFLIGVRGERTDLLVAYVALGDEHVIAYTVLYYGQADHDRMSDRRVPATEVIRWNRAFQSIDVLPDVEVHHV